MVSSFLMINACHQLNVARTARQARTINSMWRDMPFRAQWGLVPIDPFRVLACALCRRRTKWGGHNGVGITFCRCTHPILKCICFVRFSNMGTEWGGYHVHLLFESLFFFILSMCYFDVSQLCSWVMLNSHRCLRNRTSVVRHGYFVCPASPFLFWMVCVTLMTFLLVMMLRTKRVHFIWSSIFTILFCLVCDDPAASAISSYDEAFVYLFEFSCNWW